LFSMDWVILSPMPTSSLLGASRLMAFVSTTDAARARKFYRDVLGLRLAKEELPFALVFDAHGVMLRVTIVKKVAKAPYTVLGWRVRNIVAKVTKLHKAGVKFERYPGMHQDRQGIWTAPGSARIAWFRDPDGNLLSVAQL